MKKLLLPLFLLITSCGDIITKIEKDEGPVQTIEELSHIQITAKEARTNLLDCALYIYKQHPFDQFASGYHVDYINSARRLAILAKGYANANRSEEAVTLFQTAVDIADAYLVNFDMDHANTLSFIAQMQLDSGMKDSAQHTLHKALKTTQATRPQMQHYARENLVPLLVYGDMIDEAIGMSNQMDEHDRIMVLAKAAIEWAKNDQIEKANETVNQLYQNIFNLEEREINIKPVKVLNCYAHVIGAYHALSNEDTCKQLLEQMTSIINKTPLLTPKQFIESAKILAEDYDLAEYAYTITTCSPNGFKGAKENDLIRITESLFQHNKIEEGSVLLDEFRNEWFQVMNLTNKANAALRESKMTIWNDCIDQANTILTSSSDSTASMHSMLANSHAQAKEKKQMIEHCVSSLIQLQETSVNNNSVYVRLAKALYENGYTEPPEIQAELKTIIEEHI